MKVLNKEVECVCTFASNGKMRPERIRLNTDEEESVVITIERVQKQDKVKFEGQIFVNFLCQAVINGTQKLFELRYYNATCKWILYKI